MRLALVTAAVILTLPASALGMTKADAVNLANAVNLQGADLPGYAVTPPDQTTADGSMARCAGSVPPQQAVAIVDSANFERGLKATYRDVSSEIEVLPSETLATQDFTAIRSKRAQRCIVKKTKGQTLAGVGRVVGVKVTLLRAQVPGAFGYRIAMQIRHGFFGTIPLILDLYAVHEGPAEATLSVVSGAKGKLRASEADRLLGLLQTRLHAALNPSPSA